MLQMWKQLSLHWKTDPIAIIDYHIYACTHWCVKKEDWTSFASKCDEKIYRPSCGFYTDVCSRKRKNSPKRCTLFYARHYQRKYLTAKTHDSSIYRATVQRSLSIVRWNVTEGKIKHICFFVWLRILVTSVLKEAKFAASKFISPCFP